MCIYIYMYMICIYIHIYVHTSIFLCMLLCFDVCAGWSLPVQHVPRGIPHKRIGDVILPAFLKTDQLFDLLLAWGFIWLCSAGIVVCVVALCLVCLPATSGNQGS